MAITGSGSFTHGIEGATVVNAGVLTTWFIDVQLTSDPGVDAGGAAFEHVIKDAGVGFYAELSNAPQNDTTFEYTRRLRTGEATIPAGKALVTVSDGIVGATSIVLVCLTSDPGDVAGGPVVQAVETTAGTGFTIYLSNAVIGATTFDYYIVNRTGTGTVPQGVTSYYVAAPTVASDSAISVAFTADPAVSAGGAVIKNVIKTAGYGFTLEFANGPIDDSTFDYYIS